MAFSSGLLEEDEENSLVGSYYSPASAVIAHKGKLSRRGLWRGSSLQGLDGTFEETVEISEKNS